MRLGITDHIEGAIGESPAGIFAQIAEQTELADRLGFEFAWFAEHHAHAHRGHLPTPLLFALHMAARTRRIRLGTGIICLNLHHPLSVAEECKVADLLMNGRGAFGFGSGSTPEEFALFGLPVSEDAQRHARFAAALKLIVAAFEGQVGREQGEAFGVLPHASLPIAAGNDLHARSWVAVNSQASARIAGSLGFNMLFSHLRTPEQYFDYAAEYRAAGGRGWIAANRPVHVAKDDATAYARAEPALRTLWQRFQAEGKIAPGAVEPRDIAALCAHPINFLVGSAKTVARQLSELNAHAPFDVANVEVRWEGLSRDAIHDCMERLAGELGVSATCQHGRGPV